MKTFRWFSVGLGLLFIAANTVTAQETPSPVTGPPKVLVIQREFVKPGKSGSLHQKSESAFVQAFTAAKWPTHYLAMDSLSGASRSLFTTGYDSFAAWEKDTEGMRKNATLSAAMDRAMIADGDLLSGYTSSTFIYREDLSLPGSVKLGQMRYFEISRFKVRPGHRKEWEDLGKMYVDAYKKAGVSTHWAAYEDMYGNESGGLYLIMTPMKSIAEVDKNMSDEKQVMAAMGEDGMKKMGELAAASIESSESNLFAFNPKMSYPYDEWINADPTFWKAKMTVPATKPAAKPAQ